MEENTRLQSEEILQGITRHVNCFSEQNRNTRKKSIEGIRKEILDRKPALDPEILQSVFHEIQKPLLKLVSDPVEKCRELTISLITDCVQEIPAPEQVLPFLLPVMVQRLGQQDIIESSEELRHQLILLLQILVDKNQNKMAPYMDDIIRILQRTICDPFPEVKKHSAKCTSSLARCTAQHFHLQSESLIKPLLTSFSHQHSKVRVEMILALGDVIQFGNGKTLPDVVSHLAQRLFDQASTVRAAVIQVVGNWMLDLLDRYSYFPKLIPLLLTGLTDELPDIRAQADALWHDVGLKYEGENEEDLKDKQDFVKSDPDHYPQGVERPNLGCRTLMYHHFSKIVVGIVNDISDWVGQTRIKSAQLLYTMMLSEEDNVTQHLQKVLTGLYKACGDEEKEVVTYVKKSAELIGYFVSPEVWCKMILQNVKSTQSFGSLMILAAVIRGSQRSKLNAYLQDICSVLTDPLVCRIADLNVQMQLLECVQAIIGVCLSDCRDISFQLFSAIISVLALHRSDDIRLKCYQLLESLANSQEVDSVQGLFQNHTRELISSLQEDYAHWTQHSAERHIFDTLLMECGPVVGEILEDVIPMIVANIHPDKDPEVRLKFFSLLSRLMMNAGQTLDSQQRFGDFAVIVVRDMVLPNCVWRAGRVAAAIRKTAISCLWALLNSGVLTRERLEEVMEDLVTQLRSTLEDDNKDTRLVSCRILSRIFNTSGQHLDQDRLHNMYPDLLKRLDDSSDDIRVAMCKTFQAYFDCFQDRYEVSLYRAHLDALYKGLLVHMDDPDVKIQESVLDVLKTAARLSPDMLLKEIDVVRHKHRSTKYCDLLQEYINALPRPE